MYCPALESYARNRLVRKNIAFIVPGSQMFLPTALIDLRERQPSLRPVKSDRLTPAAQCLVLYHLQRSTLSGTALQDVARKIGYTPVMLTRVRSELENAGMCESVRQGRTTRLRFLLKGKDTVGTCPPASFRSRIGSGFGPSGNNPAILLSSLESVRSAVGP